MQEAKEVILNLLNERETDKSICPSEAAKRITPPGEDWRSKMDEIHQTVDTMVEAGSIKLSWKGQQMQQRRGPYRIARRRNI